MKDVPEPQITRVAMHTLTWGLLQGWALGPFFFDFSTQVEMEQMVFFLFSV